MLVAKGTDKMDAGENIYSVVYLCRDSEVEEVGYNPHPLHGYVGRPYRTQVRNPVTQRVA